mmetsp:Transcript_4841/g.14082  ORF Transcript_4841/g.14082 Transcript_4841/m.14082 type:complete len:236 (+) Transcript_4841:367-1074(+)
MRVMCSSREPLHWDSHYVVPFPDVLRRHRQPSGGRCNCELVDVNRRDDLLLHPSNLELSNAGVLECCLDGLDLLAGDSMVHQCCARPDLEPPIFARHRHRSFVLVPQAQCARRDQRVPRRLYPLVVPIRRCALGGGLHVEDRAGGGRDLGCQDHGSLACVSHVAGGGRTGYPLQDGPVPALGGLVTARHDVRCCGGPRREFADDGSRGLPCESAYAWAGQVVEGHGRPRPCRSRP